MEENTYHTRYPAFSSDVSWYTFQGHNSASTSFLGNPRLIIRRVCYVLRVYIESNHGGRGGGEGKGISHELRF